MRQAYVVKNTFAEFPESDESDGESAPPMQRSNSWSAFNSTPAMSSSTERESDDGPVRSSLSRSLRPATAPCLAAPLQSAFEGAVGPGHVVFESSASGGSSSFSCSSPPAKKATASSTATFLPATSGVSSAPQNAYSELHQNGACTPCLRFILKEGCKDGDACKYCHLSHTGEKLRQRPGKGSRAKCQQLIQDIRKSYPDREERLDQLQELVQEKHPFTRSLLLFKIKDYENQLVLHAVGPVDTSRPLPHELEFDDERGAIPGYATLRPSTAEVLLQKMAHHQAKKSQLAESFRANRRQLETEQNDGAPEGYERTRPNLLESGLVSESQSSRHTKMSL